VEEKGVPLDTIVQAHLAAHKELLDARVAAGALTQEQADAWLAQVESRFTAMLTSGFGPGMMWGPRAPATPAQGTTPGYGAGYGPGGRFGPRQP
jgi:hypothetical protein